VITHARYDAKQESWLRYDARSTQWQ
jgi:hypothetical protein